jgi:DNA polymerase-3 subunit delta
MRSASAKVCSVYAIVSPDGFLRREALDRIIADLGGEIDTLGPTRVDGGYAQLADVLDEVRTMSLLSGRRVVVLDEADEFISANRQALERYCSTPCDTGCLILVCDSLPTNTRLYKIISERGAVIRRDPPKPWAVVGWLADRAQTAYGKRLGRGAGERLREHLGDALGQLDTELAKLAAYVGRRDEITPADIDTLTGQSREEKVFAVTDSMAAYDTAAALRHWEQVLATDRAAPGRAIAGLAWGVRRLLETRRDWERGADIGELARRMYTDPATLRRRLEGLTTDQLEEQQRDLLAAELAVKTGVSTVEVAVEKFIVKHSVGRAGRPAPLQESSHGR